MLWAILSKSERQHPTKEHLYGHRPPITKTIQVRRTRHAGHCWRSEHKLISDILLWISSHGRAKPGRPARVYIQQPSADKECSLEYLPKAMNGRDGGKKGSGRFVWAEQHDIYIYIYIYIYMCVCVCVCMCANASVCVFVILSVNGTSRELIGFKYKRIWKKEELIKHIILIICYHRKNLNQWSHR